METDAFIAAVVGSTLTLLGREAASWLARTVLPRGELARDGLVDIASTVRGVERTYPRLSAARSPANYEALVAYPSRWSIGRPVLGPEIYVREFGNERTHRDAILLFD